jgi:AsmA protein
MAMKSVMTKSRLIKSAAAMAALFVVVAFVLPWLVDMDSMRPKLESILGSALSREVHIGKMELSILAGGLRAHDLSIADDPAFSSERFLESKALGVKVGLFSLIFSHTLHVNSLIVEQPRVNLVRSSSGQWNFSTIGGNAEHVDADTAAIDSWFAPSDPDCSQPFVFDQIKITNGTILMPATVTASDDDSKKVTLENINIDLHNVNIDKVMSFVISERVPGGAKIELRGEAGPVDHNNPEGTPFHSTISLTHMDLAKAMGPFASSGLSGVLALNASVTSDGKTLRSEGHGHVDKLRVARTGTPSNQGISFLYSTDYSMKKESGVVRSGEISAGKGQVEVSGSYSTRGGVFVSHLKLRGSDVPLDSVQVVLGALGVELPAGSKLHAGTVTASVSLEGPMDRLVTSGTAELTNARLTAFDLGSKLANIKGLSGLKSGPDLRIESLSSQFRVAPQDTQISNFKSEFTGIGGVTGEGNIDATSHLDLAMVAHIPSQGVTRTILNHVGLSGVPNDVPFKVTGTTSLPIFEPDLSVMAKSAAKNAASEGAKKLLSDAKKNAATQAKNAINQAPKKVAEPEKILPVVAKQEPPAKKPNAPAPTITAQNNNTKKPGGFFNHVGHIFHKDKNVKSSAPATKE